MNKKNTLNYPKSAAMGFFSKGLKNEFETAVVNEPSVFEPLKFYCIWSLWPYWSCDLDHLHIFLFPPTLKATYEIWLQLAEWLLR